MLRVGQNKNSSCLEQKLAATVSFHICIKAYDFCSVTPGFQSLSLSSVQIQILNAFLIVMYPT